MKPVIHNVTQGSPEWLALRANYYTASEASAMLGVSKYQSRAALLRQKATGHAPEVDSATQAIFNRGHETEALAISIAEGMIGEALFPTTVTADIDGLPLLASCDGMTLAGSPLFEHKLINNELRKINTAEDLADHYRAQMEQQLMVTGATHCLFIASDGTEDDCVRVWYESDPALRQRIIAGWAQFAADLRTYQHEEAKAEAVASPQEILPTVVVQVSGQIAVSGNLTAFGDALRGYIEKLNLKPEDDQDFADLDAATKALKKAEDALTTAEDQAIAQAGSLDDLRRTIGDYRALARTTRLRAEKIVKAEKENRRNAIHSGAVDEVRAHYESLSASLVAAKGPQLTCPALQISSAVTEAMKGKKTIKSWKDAAAQVVADEKIKANAKAEQIRAHLAELDGIAEEHRHLFPDRLALAMEPANHVEATIKVRVAAWKEQEAKRIEVEREKIRAEEEAKGEARQPRETRIRPEEQQCAKPDQAAYVHAEKEEPSAGKIAITVTFAAEIPEHVTDDQVTADLRKVMAAAGITTLSGISVKRNLTQLVPSAALSPRPSR
jgi:putative phage-type endonuclease